MENILENEPNLSNFISSLRDIGYSLETAVADIVDNSIAAGAKTIRIFVNVEKKQVAFLDDGKGMDASELRNAMKLGSFSPDEERSKNDLGRFGLGLKTASFSQCTKLSVVSNKNGIETGYAWDLDYIKSQNAWLMKNVDKEQYKIDAFYDYLLNNKDYTLVVWDNVDRFETDEDFTYSMGLLNEHLSMVFHRFMSGEKGVTSHKVNIFINERELEPFDPFFSSHPATQEKPEDIEYIYGEPIIIKPYILPHHSKISETEYEKYATKDGYQKAQGFYLYRAGRLLIHGTWFRLHKQCEAHKLVRIKIDISNKLDKFWNIDVKKSTATPSAQIREALKRVISNITTQGFKVYSSRGTIEKKSITHYWDIKHVHGDEKLKFILNREHPSYKLLKMMMDEASFSVFEKYISDVENFIPLNDICSKYMNNEKQIEQKESIPEEELDLIINAYIDSNISKADIYEILKKSEGFKDNLEYVKKKLEVQDD